MEEGDLRNELWRWKEGGWRRNENLVVTDSTHQESVEPRNEVAKQEVKTARKKGGSGGWGAGFC